jgi:hypothetical protein
MLTMTPHIIRVPDITDDDVAPMWVGTQNNLTFRGVSPRIESQAGIDPFTPRPAINLPTTPDGEPGNYIVPAPPAAIPVAPINGAPPADPFKRNPPDQSPPAPPEPQSLLKSSPATTTTSTPATKVASLAISANDVVSADSSSATTNNGTNTSSLVMARISPQPVHLAIKPGEMKTWNVVGMDVDGMTTNEIMLHYDPRTLAIMDVSFGNALAIDPQSPPVVNIDSSKGLVRISSSNAKPLVFNSGGEIAILRVQGGLAGDTFLVVDVPEIHNVRGETVAASIIGGRAKVQ